MTEGDGCSREFNTEDASELPMVEYTAQIYPDFKIGRCTYGRPEVLSWGEGTTLEVGAFCSIADGVKIFLGGEHRVDWVTTYPFNFLWERAYSFKGHPASKGDVIIGNDVWIGAESVIMWPAPRICTSSYVSPDCATGASSQACGTGG